MVKADGHVGKHSGGLTAIVALETNLIVESLQWLRQVPIVSGRERPYPLERHFNCLLHDWQVSVHGEYLGFCFGLAAGQVVGVEADDGVGERVGFLVPVQRDLGLDLVVETSGERGEAQRIVWTPQCR